MKLIHKLNKSLYLELKDNHIPWSKITFGNGPRVEGILKHIESEIEEVRANPEDIREWIDIVILALDGAWRSGHSAEEVVLTLFDKLVEIRTRTYPKPENDDEPSMHIKNKESV